MDYDCAHDWEMIDLTSLKFGTTINYRCTRCGGFTSEYVLGFIGSMSTLDTTHSCTWQKYIGFTDSYEYCECGVKK